MSKSCAAQHPSLRALTKRGRTWIQTAENEALTMNAAARRAIPALYNLFLSNLVKSCLLN
jgi:hypothetical protein